MITHRDLKSLNLLVSTITYNPDELSPTPPPRSSNIIVTKRVIKGTRATAKSIKRRLGDSNLAAGSRRLLVSLCVLFSVRFWSGAQSAPR